MHRRAVALILAGAFLALAPAQAHHCCNAADVYAGGQWEGESPRQVLFRVTPQGPAALVEVRDHATGALLDAFTAIYGEMAEVRVLVTNGPSKAFHLRNEAIGTYLVGYQAYEFHPVGGAAIEGVHRGDLVTMAHVVS